jgi:septum formation protein
MEQRVLFLASVSPRRAAILAQFNVPFKVVPNKLISETWNPEASIQASVRGLAREKAESSVSGYSGLVLGVDTVVALDDRVFGKPRSLEEAKEMLITLSGKTHRVVTGYCLIDTVSGKSLSRSCTTLVSFKHLTDTLISHYFENHEVLDKAGAYGIQDIKSDFVTSIDGSYYNVVGLPIEMLLKNLKKYDIV